MMTIEPLGEVTPDKSIPEWLVSEPTETAYFPGTKLVFVFENILEDTNTEEFASAARAFLNLTVADRDLATSHVFKNFTDFANAVGPEDVHVKIARQADVWRHVHPTAVHVSRRPYGDKSVYVQITAECDWEPEHGLQITYRHGNNLRRVSQQDGHLTHTDAYDLPEDEDRIS
ncbi:MAG TPA: hypothetical protein VL137_13460 [Polyangiaceae bacterium]|nr:hypothetical protein [Polyangiaceae bacterium]